MAASDTLGLIIAGALGAGGAVTAQIIASVVTGLKDTKRFNWERDKQERDWKNHEREHFLAVKQQLYAEYAAAVEAVIRYAFFRIEYDKGPDDDDVTSIRRLESLRANISLVAPESVQDALYEANDKSVKAAQDAQNDDLSIEERKESLLEARNAWRRALATMREDLLGVTGVEVHEVLKDNRP